MLLEMGTTPVLTALFLNNQNVGETMPGERLTDPAFAMYLVMMLVGELVGILGMVNLNMSRGGVPVNVVLMILGGCSMGYCLWKLIRTAS
ncbi:MAG: hypothetical protein A3I44_04410 [Candidatus Sungbacteria bacterium RIFCSPLOWO2_02_FULL_51_17]|uniref:Uncharacterized protein n=1 Tax=Candidatus Sungbacteria bacterium RIFCSPHIGHO2_02_FULL_51_29 TaxID=1802273 RepID=A0A1G2KSX7_9BACT|nr:MAG: hypothetical protein A2676_02840 [Candidatus Sungbacteria bacterium RIFCSPHIGHO2_01_FULL_51_22]OHA02364.1 MAG: hypothetical protein A3C16_01120 [Candidatus Sungbacteria bacterium RIFCSPHIGHO2_02_FULL_51_29]OHA05018.1 MAG: hypothetical protein A3B29_05050 [Candidatus Sungbacteria bacterium RIFCSPLOWO2_01_FULL_51_34]OHA10419.1 MAG: hypothetical protein A3I44_04410 [Candidatus Sungbacteria bacterium RIFCSPLOWO2_02_FULL_51_17]